MRNQVEITITEEQIESGVVPFEKPSEYDDVRLHVPYYVDPRDLLPDREWDDWNFGISLQKTFYSRGKLPEIRWEKGGSEHDD